MAPTVITRPGAVATPLDLDLGASDELTPQSAFAHFDGTGAAGAFLPALTYYTQDGRVFSRAIGQQVAAGASADVSWFPGLTTSPPAVPIGPQLSGNTLVPAAVTVSTRAIQPDVAHFGVAHFGFRVIIQQTGTLRDLAVYQATPRGNVEVAIIGTQATTRTILFKSGLVSSGAGNAWLVVADPAFPVTVGDQFDIAVGFDAATSSDVLWIGGLVNSGFTNANSAQLPPSFLPAPGGAVPRLTWQDVTSPVPYGGQATVAEAVLLNQVGVPLVIGRIV